MKLIKKGLEIIKKLYKNIWFRTFLFIILFLSFYVIREKVDITNNTRTMLNLVLLGVFFVQLYQRLNEKKISIIRFLFILIAVFILNQFYDSDIFFSIFNMRLNYAVILIGSVIFLYIIGSKVFLFIKNRKKKYSKLKNKSAFLEAQNKDIFFIEKTNKYNDIEESGINANNFEYENNLNSIKKHPEIYTDRNGAPPIKPKKNVKPSIDFNQNKEQDFRDIGQNMKFQTGVTVIICFIILLFSILSIIPLFNKNMIDKLTSIETSNGLSVYISLIGLFFLCIFMWAVVVTVFIRLVRIIFNIIKNKDPQSSYLLNACAFLAVSYFITKQYNISLDKVIDSIIQGNVLSFPILILILLPLFFTLLQNLETLIKKNEEIRKKTIDIIYKIILGIIEAILNFIKFTTADFLISIQDIVKEDLDHGTEKPLDEGLGEHVDGEEGKQSSESELNTSKE